MSESYAGKINRKLLKKRRIIQAAAGREPADLVLKNATYVNVFANQLCTADIAVAEGLIVGMGTYSGVVEHDCTGKIVLPGFLDAHIHLESSLVSPREFVTAVLPHGINHRNPGVIPAAVENKNVRAEIICDGLHIHPAAVRMAFSMFGGERMIIVSDSGRCAGQPDGTTFELGGQMATLTDGVARLADGTIACSATNMYQCLLNCISWGIPEEAVIRACTYNPACALGAQDKVGSIETGKLADFVICNPDYTGRRVFIGGTEI